MEDTNKMLCSVCGDPLYPGEGVYSFEDPNDDEKEYIFWYRRVVYWINDYR